MKLRIARSRDIHAEPGKPLDAAFWTGRGNGEDHAAWQRRMDAQEQLRIAQRHTELADAALKRAAELMGEASDAAS